MNSKSLIISYHPSKFLLFSVRKKLFEILTTNYLSVCTKILDAILTIDTLVRRVFCLPNRICMSAKKRNQ